MRPSVFMANVRKMANGCWHWTGHISRDGYGTVHVGSRTDGSRRTALAHRVAYERHHGVTLAPRGHPDHRQVDHLCHNRSKSCLGGRACQHRRCVNPAHLVLVTPRENTEASHSATAHVNRRKTHCRNGHEFTPGNTIQRKRAGGGRACRACANARSNAYKARRRAA